MQQKKKKAPILKRLFHKPFYYYLVILLIPWICFYALEYFTHDPWAMEILPQLINYAILLLFSLGLLFLTDSLLPGLLLQIGYAAAAGILNYFVMDFRGNPVLPWDIYSIGTALSVSDNYTYKFNDRFYGSVAALAISLLLGLLASRAYRKWKKKTNAQKQNQSKKNTAPQKQNLGRRLLPALLCWALCLGIGLAMMSPDITKMVLTPTNLFTQWASYRDNGFTVTFIENLQYMKISKPSGYNKNTLAQEVETWLAEHGVRAEADTNSAAISTKAAQEKDPSIFVIMDEAFSDLSVLYEFDTDQDYMPFLRSLQNDDSDRTITGNLFVSVCGGNTANTEFEFLTGNTLAYLPSGSVAYQQYIHGDLSSLASLSGNSGYETVGIHPYGSAGWNRSKVYPWLGFQTTLFKEDFTGYRILRKYYDDSSAFRKLTEVYEAKDRDKTQGNPLFAFEVTMQNHGGYTEVFDDCPNEVSVQNTTHPYAKYTNQYLTLVKKTDEALEDFIWWVDQQEEPIMVVFFGDHQPNDYVAECIVNMTGKSKDEMNLEESQNRYIVPYLIYANYDLPDSVNDTFTDTDSRLLTDTSLSVNYLGSEIARLAGLELTTYQQFLQMLEQELPVITANTVIDKNGTYMTMEEARKVYGEELNLYEKLQYCYLFDGGADTGLFN